MTDLIHNRDIPNDVLLAIFSVLDACDLVSCRQVCWQFSQVIASDLFLQYKMALAFNGLVEPSTSNMALDLPARLEGVRTYEAKLQRVTFSSTATQLLDQASEHAHWRPIASTSGSIAHIITKTNGDHMLYVYLPSSLSNGGIWHDWKVPLGPLGIRQTSHKCIAVDPLQDLLVIAETVRESWDLHIRLLSFSRGGRKSHPSATAPILKYFTSPMTMSGLMLPQVVLSVRIFAQYVVVLVAGDDEDKEELLVWDWRTGLHSLTTGVRTRTPVVALLDNSHLAVSYPLSSDVHVHCVGSCSHLERGTGPWAGCILHSQPFITLSLSGPGPFPGPTWSVASMFSDFPAEHHSDATCERSSFKALPSTAAIVFHLTTRGPDHLKKLVVLDSASLRDLFREAHLSRPVRGKTPPRLPFAEWATRCLVLDEGRKPGPYLHTAQIKPYGSKFALLSYPAADPTDGRRTGEPEHPRVHVVDTNKWVAKRTRALVDEGTTDSLVQCWEKGTDLDCFVEPMPPGERLPFAVYKGPTITFPDGHYPVESIATQNGFSLMYVDLLENSPAGFQTWTLV